MAAFRIVCKMRLNDFLKLLLIYRIRGCYVSRLSHGGRIVSIAINQLQPYLSSMLFVDVYHHAAIASSFQHVYSQNVKALPSFTK